jgi:CBS domain-containing protein
MEGFAKMWMTAPFVGAYPTIESLRFSSGDVHSDRHSPATPKLAFPVTRRKNVMNASDIMVRKVITTHPQASVSHVAKQLVDNDISALPVVDDAGWHNQ